MAGQQQQMQQPGPMDLATFMGRPLFVSEERDIQRNYQQYMDALIEQQRLVNEQKKLQLESERQKQSLITQAIQSMLPSWERGGQRVDVGGFGRDGKSMQQVAVGPGAPGKEITPASQARFVQPLQGQGMGQELARVTVGLSARDPVEDFARQMALWDKKESAKTAADERKATAKERELEIKASAKEKEIRLKEEQDFLRQAKLQAKNQLLAERNSTMKELSGIDKLIGVREEDKAALREEIKKRHNYFITGYRGQLKEDYKLDMDVKPYLLEEDAAVLTKDEIQKLRVIKKKNKKRSEALAAAYAKQDGKPLVLSEVKE
jgi:hypothetical protein